MRLGARLAKLEEKAPAVLRCAWCRYSLVEDVQVKAAGGEITREFVMRSCRWCGNEFRIPLDSYTPKEREAYLLWAYLFDGETYRDERAFAAKRWCVARQYVRFLREPEKRIAARALRKQPDRKADKYAQERAALKEESDALVNSARERQKRLYGPRTFPLVATLEAFEVELKALNKSTYESGYVYRTAEEKGACMGLIYARIMRECELALWGEPEPDTLAEIEGRTVEVAEYEAERALKAEAEAREREERDKARRLEDEARTRRIVEAGMIQKPAPVGTPKKEDSGAGAWLRDYEPPPEQPVSRFRKTGGPVTHDLVVIPEPGGYDPNHPDAVQFQRSTPEKPLERRYYRGENYEGDPRY